MAIFHLAHSFVRRSNSSSSLAAAAYNSGQKIEDSQGSSEFSDYTSRGGVLVSAIMLPTGTPAWANNRGELWRRLEAREDKSTRRADAMLAHNFNIALPHELTLEQNIFLAKDYSGSALNKIGSGNNSNSGSKFTPAMKPSSSKAWPPQALADWVEWGSKQPARFFAKWSELSEGNAVAGGPSL